MLCKEVKAVPLAHWPASALRKPGVRDLQTLRRPVGWRAVAAVSAVGARLPVLLVAICAFGGKGVVLLYCWLLTNTDPY